MIDDSTVTIEDVIAQPSPLPPPSDDIMIEDVPESLSSSLLPKEEVIPLLEKKEDDYYNVDDVQLINILADKIKEVDNRWRGNPDDVVKCQLLMTELLCYIENEFGFECLKDVILIINDDLGHPLGLFPKSLIKRLVREGWVHDKQKNEVRPLNDEELIDLFNQQPTTKKKKKLQ